MTSLYWRNARRLLEAMRGSAPLMRRSSSRMPWRIALPALSFFGNVRMAQAGAISGGAAAIMSLFGLSSADSTESITDTTQTTLCRVMLPDDANPSGNVHGGTILHLIEQAGWIVATRHCNSKSSSDGSGFFSSKELSAALVRVEHMDFIQPMFIGEVAQVTANVIFTSTRSMEVRVEVWAENAAKCQRRLTNQAILWYVAVPLDQETAAGHLKSQPVPPLPSSLTLRKEVAAAARQRYIAQKAERAQACELAGDARLAALQPVRDAAPYSPDASQSSLQHVVLPSECFSNRIAQGGVVMKLMDTVAGVTAARHSRSGSVVTASLDAIDFHAPVLNGNLVTVTGRVTHSSRRSMEIEVVVFTDNAVTGERKPTNTAYFTFVTLNKLTGKVGDVPPLVPVTDADKQRFADGQLRYEERKQARKTNKV